MATTAESILDTTPIFSIKNYFKPTPKNILILGDILISLGGLVTTSALAALSVHVGIAGMVLSGLGLILQRLTKEESASTIVQAIEDIKEEGNDTK